MKTPNTTQTTAKHTPGPWHVDAEEILGAHDIASVFPVNGHGVICRVPGNDKTTDERDANARLIALAPEYYAAVAQFLADWENGGNLSAAAQRLAAVQTKAEGRT